MLKYSLPLLLVFFLFQGAASADYYQWEDENGNVNITDYPPPTKAARHVEVHRPEPGSRKAPPEPQEIRPTEPKAASRQGTPKTHQVILYTTSWCPYCKMAREFFTSRNIDFIEYDIEKDGEAAARKQRLDGKNGVPFAIVNGRQIHGYSQSAYEEALK